MAHRQSTADLELVTATRSMLLPIATGLESQYLEFVQNALQAEEVSQADQPQWIYLQLRRWRKQGKPTPEFAALVSKALHDDDRLANASFVFERASDGSSSVPYTQVSKDIAKSYFKIHKALVDSRLFAHDAARQLLSHLGMIVRLRVEENMSCSEISRIISIRDPRFEFNWPAIREILRPLGLAPSLTEEGMNDTLEEDARNEPLYFGDLDIAGAIQKVAASAAELGCPGEFEAWLRDILLVEDVHAPFLVILHYQLSSLAQYDHAVTYAYEFAPRGRLLLKLTEEYAKHGSIAAKSPFLNNAKATLRLDKGWAVGRDSLRSATALASILGQLEALGALAKQELAAEIRALLHRFLRVTRAEKPGGLVDELPRLNDREIEILFAAVGGGNTATTGIIEQRLVDCYASAVHPASNSWVAKGRGDSVFAPNIPRRKFGDVEFERTSGSAPCIHAYESHAGSLTEAYLEDHMDSFTEVLHARRTDLEAIKPLEDWVFKVTFVAHKFSRGIASRKVWEIGDTGIKASLSYLPFSDLHESVGKTPEFEGLFAVHFVKELNNVFVHPDVRLKARQLTGLGA